MNEGDMALKNMQFDKKESGEILDYCPICHEPPFGTKPAIHWPIHTHCLFKGPQPKVFIEQ